MNAPQSPLLRLTGLGKRFGGFTALENVELVVGRGERLGLIGPNGSGKSTLVSCIAGTLRHDAGRIEFEGRDIGRKPAFRRVHLGVARSFQIPRPFWSMTVVDNLRIPLLYGSGARVTLDAGRATDEAMHILEQVGLGARAHEKSGVLTQVDMRKLELARAVAARPKLLIADDAMAGLSASEVDEILALLLKLNQQGIAVIMIEHIMRAVMAFSQRIAVLVAGKKIADAAPDEVIRNPEVEKAYLGQ